MNFFSLEFLIFFIAILVIFIFVKKAKVRLPLLLLANLVFYSIGGGFIALGIFVAIIAYFYGYSFLIKKYKKKWTLILGIVLSLLPLLFFKYLSYIFRQYNVSTFSGVFSTVGVPLGISFFTLQGISYFADVYSGKVEVEKNPLFVGIFLSLFSTVTSGPFENYSHVVDQLKKDYEFNYEQTADGLKNMVLGMFLKLFVAENLGIIVNAYYTSPGGNYSSLWLLLSTILFGFQLYADFYGYSLIAKGTAETMGIELMDNFHQPFLSSSISSFWSRWHISFQKWLTKHIYIPLGGSRVKTPRILANVLIVFLVSGLWHGTGLTFICWGLVNGLYICLERLLHLNSKQKVGWRRIVGTIYTFIFITISWIFFRANSISDVGIIFKQIFVGVPKDLYHAFNGTISWAVFNPSVRVGFGFIGLFLVWILDFVERKFGSLVTIINKWNSVLRLIFYIALIFVAIGFVKWGETSEFMYAQF
ncbi:MAG: hypothetical protein MJ225_00705 [Bacilli bacterium]|nr:hypothetical protein [Bacilli bacterium]